MKKSSNKLLSKITTPIEAQLEEAIMANKVGSVYEPSLPKQASENTQEYIARIIRESEEYQFVKVEDNRGKVQYAAFGVSGPVINDIAEFLLVPAQIVGGIWGVHHFLIYPNLQTLKNQNELFLRLDSGCFIGMVLSDNTCDCKKQLEVAMQKCKDFGAGVIIEIPSQDGRGWGEYKMANQRISHELGVNTVDTARLFYGDDESSDRRTYDEAALLLKAIGLGDKKIKLGTNNPKKISAFASLGMAVQETESIIADNLSKSARTGLEAKSKDWGHKM